MIFMNKNLGSREKPNYQSAILLEPTDIPTKEIFSLFREKFKPGRYWFTKDQNQNDLAPFYNYYIYLDYFSHLSSSTKEERDKAFNCGLRLKAMHNIAKQLREYFINSAEERKELKRQEKQNIYCACRDGKNIIFITQSEVDSVLAQIEALKAPTETNAPATQEVPSKEYKRKPRHWLLSTSKTISHFKIRGYSGKNFSYDRNWNKSPTEKSIFRLYSRVFHDVIIPNALIAKSAGKTVEFDDVALAIGYVMTNPKRLKAWKSLIGDTTDNEWITNNALQNFNFYVYDRLRSSDKLLPEKDRWTLDKYLEKTRAGKFTNNNEDFQWTASPKVKMLIDEFLKDRDIGNLTYKEIIDRFKVGRATVAKFFALLKERRKTCSDYDFITF